MAVREIAELVIGLTTANEKLDKVQVINKLAEQIIETQKWKELAESLQNEKDNPLVFRNGLYYSADDTDNSYPYCSACYEDLKKRIHLVKQKCPVCATEFFEASGPFVIVSHHGSSVLDGY